MKSFALMSIIACANALTEAGAEQFAEGFLDGVFGTVEGAVKCIRHLNIVANEAEITLNYLKRHSYISAIEEMARIAAGFSMDITFCQGLGLESQQLVIQLDNIYNPASPWDIFI